MMRERILVTGGASGIGEATARLALERGARVALLDRHNPSLRHHDAISFTVDITQEDHVRSAVDEACAAWGAPPTAVIHAAGVYRIQPAVETSLQEWNDVLAINLTGSMLVASATARVMSSSGGAIVLLSSIAADRGDAYEPAAHYAASKGGVSALTRQLAVEWGARGIRVNAVAPGVIATPMLRIADDRAALDSYLQASVPLRRLGTAEEVAQTCLFLASPAASYITGAVVPVDGGAGAA